MSGNSGPLGFVSPSNATVFICSLQGKVGLNLLGRGRCVPIIAGKCRDLHPFVRIGRRKLLSIVKTYSKIIVGGGFVRCMAIPGVLGTGRTMTKIL